MSKLVLIVDDNELVLAALVKEVGDRYGVLQAASHAEAQNILVERGVDIGAIVCDFVLGVGPSGADLLAEIRQSKPDVVRIMVTGVMEEQSLAALLVSGAAHVCVRKPWRGGEIVEALRRRL